MHFQLKPSVNWSLFAIFLIPVVGLASEPTLPYTVQKGDKLIRVTKDMLVQPADWKAIARLNGMPDPNVIKPGQTVQVPVRMLKSQPLEAKVVAAAGDVQVAGSRAQAGQSLGEASRITTGPNSSAVVELADGSRVQLLPGSVAELARQREYRMRDGSAGGSSTWFSGTVRLVQGSVETLASKLSRRATPLQVETPTALVGVRGTRFRVAHDESVGRSSRSEVLEGLVRADNPVQASGADLPAGTGAVVDPTRKEVRVVALLSAPDLTAAASQVRRPTPVWGLPALGDAQAYRVQVAQDEKFERIMGDLRTTTPAVDLSGIPNGTWHVRVRRIDPNGLEGFDASRTVAIADAPPAPAPAPQPPAVSARVVSSSMSLRNGQTSLRFEPAYSGIAATAIRGYAMVLAHDRALNQVVGKAEATAPNLQLPTEIKPGMYFARLTARTDSGQELDLGLYQLDIHMNWGISISDSMFVLQPLAASGS